MNALESSQAPNHRILIIDDNPSIHDDFRKVLGSAPNENLEALEDDEAALFGSGPSKLATVLFELESAFQGQEGLEAVRAAAQAGRPFALAFVDVRMPPGWDGIETISRIWKEFPDLQVVICTAYSDYSWDDITRTLGESDSVLILKKPFDSVEVLQMAHTLTKKWLLAKAAQQQMQELDRAVNERTVELRTANEQLKSEMSERTAAESALRQSEERFSKSFQASPVPMAIEHLECAAFIDVNDSFVSMTGRTREELIGNADTAREIWNDTGMPGLLRNLLNGDKPPREMPVTIRTKDGGKRDALLFTELVELGGEDHMLLIVQDITEHARLEGQLRQAQKMEAVGQLAAGIAHDFNNLLTVILGNTSHQLHNMRLDEGIARALRQIEAASERAAALTRQLLAYSRKQIIRRGALDLNETAERSVAMLRRVIGEHIAVETVLSPDLPTVYADPTSVDQVLMNLTLNARDAMPDGGKLTVRTELCEIDERQLARHPAARTGTFVCLTVQDTGGGMDATTMAHLFEPFFTTKELGKGTGMGLATVYGIVQQHEGWVEVESEPWRGAAFHVYLPLSRNAAAAGEKPAAPRLLHASADPAINRATTILVVEDEDMLREFVQSVLEALGYHVLAAANGAEALEVWEREKGAIHLLLTDVVMPESISGWQLARRLSEKKPDLRVIFTSGYSAELITPEFEQGTDFQFLSKPYLSDKLAKTVADCLRDGPAEALAEDGAHQEPQLLAS